MPEKKHLKIAALYALTALLLLSAGCAVTVGGVRAERDAVSLDLRNAGITDTQSLANLKKLKDLRSLDLRGNALGCVQIDEIAAALPECEILWSVPIGSKRFDSDSASLALTDLPEDEVSALAYFPNLTSVDATGCTQYAALTEAAERYPGVSFVWSVSAGGVTYSNDETDVCLSSGVTASDVAALLAALPKLEAVDLLGTGLLAGDVASLEEQYPNVRFRVNASLQGGLYETDTTAVDLTDLETFDLETFAQELAQFPSMKYVDLRTLPVAESDIALLTERYPGTHFRWTVPLLDGFLADSDAAELDLRGCTVSDAAEFQRKLSLFSQLTYIDMCNCGPSDEEMEAMRSAMPNIKFVWMLHIAYWEVRTDAKAFSLSQVHEFQGVRYTKEDDAVRRYRWVTDAEIKKLQYCTDLEALDIGHAYLISNIDFVRNLKQLRFLVVSGTAVSDISPVESLSQLVFLEIFHNQVTDISALASLSNLEYLNCGLDAITSIEPLLNLKNLQRLWVIHCYLTTEQIDTLKEALPDTIVMAKGKHPTDSGWRYANPRYIEMQTLLGLEPQLMDVFPGW